MYVITDQEDQQRFKRRLPNQLPVALETLAPFRPRRKVVVVESPYNWYWLVDGLRDRQYPVVLANPGVIDQYDGIKEADDLTDAAFLARLEILPTGDLYPQEERPVRDLRRRRSLVVRPRASTILSLQNMALRTLPGVGVVLALTILLETGDLGRFATVGDYTSYGRGVRAPHTSNGKSKGKNHGKNGNAYLAWAFVAAVHHALRTCPSARSFYDTKCATRNGALATKALAAQGSKAAYYMIKRQESFDRARVFG